MPKNVLITNSERTGILDCFKNIKTLSNQFLEKSYWIMNFSRTYQRSVVSLSSLAYARVRFWFDVQLITIEAILSERGKESICTSIEAPAQKIVTFQV